MDEISSEKITSDLGFYEVNPCKISLFEFIIKNPNVMYQDHYFINTYEYSSISCFGKISGITQVGYDFYIAVGTNNLISIVSQGLFWIFIISLIKKDQKIFEIKKPKIYLTSFLTSTLFIFLIFAESRFYRDSYYLMDFEDPYTFLYIFVSIFLIVDFSSTVTITRFGKLINYIPFSFLLIGTFNGLNFHYLHLILVFFGIYSFFFEKVLSKFNKLFIVFSILWSIDAYNHRVLYFLDPDKLRGMTSSFYSPQSIFAWSLLTLLSINGLIYILKKTLKNFDIELFLKNSLFTVHLIIILGYLGAHNPIVKFFNFYFFGQQKYGINEKNLFAFNEWGEKVAWRGFYPSAESIGEFYGLVILILIFKIFMFKERNIKNWLFILPPTLGLYLSNNRTVFVLILVYLGLLLTKRIQNRKFFLLANLIIIFAVFFYFVLSANLQYDFSFYNEALYNQINFYTLNENSSSFSIYINRIYDENTISMYVFSLFSFLSFILNRSELWGVYFSRYNPTGSEILFGSGPYNFAKFYGEIDVLNSYRYRDAFLLPHSSLLSFLIFFGCIGVLGLLTYVAFKIWKNKKNLKIESYMLIIYILVNLLKSDSINYLPSGLIYFSIIYIFLSQNNNSFFKRWTSINNPQEEIKH